jgi:hypothetical protein
MEKVLKVFRSFEECDRGDKEYYQSLNPQQRLEILFELDCRLPVSVDHEASERLEKVYRIIKLS